MMYEADERFTAYYDERSGHGAAKALNEIIQKKRRNLLHDPTKSTRKMT